MWEIHTVGYDSSLKRQGTLQHATALRNLEVPVLREMSVPRRQIPHDSPLCELSRVVTFTETESRVAVARDWGWRRWGGGELPVHGEGRGKAAMAAHQCECA